ncbi:putative tandem protein 21 [Amphidinium carterae]
MMRHLLLGLALLCMSLVARGEECTASDCPSEQANMLVQRTKAASHDLRAGSKKQTKKAQVSHSGTLKMLLTEMEDFIDKKGKSGIDGDEIAHIHGIKALIDETILPAILDQVEEHRTELAGLMDVIRDCEAHAVGVVNSTMVKEEDVDNLMTVTRSCVTREDILKSKATEACETVNKSRLVIYLPTEEDFPPPNVPDEEMIKYLHLMDDFYCGKYEVFEDEVTTCETLWDNWTITHQECLYAEKEFEEVSCKWKTHLDKSCEYFDTCWTEAVKAYNQRKKEILDLQYSEIDEYEGATKIQCLWKAWIYEELPCTVNETQIRICHEYPPNYTNITIEFPPPPPPPSCSTASVELEICSDDWVNINYGALGISQEIMNELRANCVPCPSYSWTSAPVVTQHVHMFNAMHSSGNAYMKTSGKSDKCDAYVETDDPNVQSVLFTADSFSKFVLSIGTNTTTVALDLENGAATVDDGTDGLAIYSLEDGEAPSQFGITISAGTAIFTKDGVMFHEQPDLPEDFVSGFGKLQICGTPGTPALVDFTLTE